MIRDDHAVRARRLHLTCLILLMTVMTSPSFAQHDILENYDATLTTYVASGASAAQDIRPHYAQRARGIDGEGLRGSGYQPDLGAYGIMETDLTFPAYVPWRIGRSYNALQETSTPAHRNSNGPQGYNWFQNSMPELVFYDDPSDPDDDVIYLLHGAGSYSEYQRFDASSDEFRGVNGTHGVFQYAAGAGGEPDTYTLYLPSGQRMVFFGGNTASNKADWQLWRILGTDAAHVAYVGHKTTASTAVTNGYNANGCITTAYDSSDRRYSYTYTTIDSVERLTEVVAEIKSGATWASPGTVTEIGSVEYEYYASTDATDDRANGDDGNLKLVTVTIPLTDSGVNEVRHSYYRYWKGAFNDSTNPGHAYALKYVYDAEGVRQLDWADDSTLNESFKETASDSIKAYASTYLEYNSSHQIDKAWYNGECGCSGASNGVYEYTYGTTGSVAASYDSAWKRRTITARPDGAYQTQYFDEVHQRLTSVLSDQDPSTASNFWVTEVIRNSDGQVSEVRSPTNIDTYTHSTGAITNEAGAGLVTVYGRVSSGYMTGFVEHVSHKEGTSGTAYYDRSIEYVTAGADIADKVIGDTTLYAVNVDKQYSYHTETTTALSDANSDDVTVKTTPVSAELYKASGKQEPEAVDGSKNGSAAVNTALRNYRVSQTVDFAKSSDGRISFTDFTDDGQVEVSVRDANTTSLLGHTDFAYGNVPAAFKDVGGLHLRTEYTYDNQGRVDTVKDPAGDTSKAYYSKLADGRLVTLQIPRFTTGGSTTFYGPVSYSVRNLAGGVDAQGIIALSGNSTTTALTSWIDESDDDPITAVDHGTLTRLTASVYNETGGTMGESRMYFDVPGTWPGTEGTHFDATYFGYDDMGRRWRTKDPTGTISRTVYDSIGRPIESWVGTNDHDFDGGESAGTDNMVKVAATQYDGGTAGGLGLVTKTTAYVVDGDTDKRETSYVYDYRGRQKVTITAQGPHTVVKLDNLGRTIAVGTYSSSSGLDDDTDPTSETTNRIGLSETSYDEEGRVYMTERHKIDPSDGSLDDTLVTRYWFDAAGRQIKMVGPQITKTVYDSLGRATHQFVLASTNDASYADASGVSGDIVLQESQTAYEDDTSLVLMQATISRFHDDYGGGETTGALDTHGDGDLLEHTAADIQGRIQIMAMWYDDEHRLSDQVAFGTYGGSDFDRDGMSVPARSATALRTSYTYNDDGTLLSMTDPKGIETRHEYDDAGRQVTTIANYVNGTPSGVTGDDDVFTRVVYTNGQQTKLFVDLDGDNVEDADDQVTVYTYGTPQGGSAGESVIATGHLLYRTAYPDSGGVSDTVTMAYNAQGQPTWTRDQEGNIIEMNYDTGGRLTHLRITTLDADFDGAVRRISMAYDGHGRTSTVTQYDNAAVGSGSVVDQVEYEYDDWGPVSNFHQDHNSAVGAGTPDHYRVRHVYANGSPGTIEAGWHSIRHSTLSYFVNTTHFHRINYRYLSGGGRHDDAINRVTYVQHLDETLDVAGYAYNGVGEVVRIDYPEPDVFQSLDPAANNSYADLDRFNRIISNRWTKDLGTDVDFYDIDITWDENSNITLIEDNIYPGYDTAYTMDGLNRLADAQRGTWNGSSITSKTNGEIWSLTQTGNWDLYQLDLDGDNAYTGTDELEDAGTFNVVNEWLERDIDNDSNPDFFRTYDASGNLVDDGENYKYVWDPFGRLRKVLDRSDDSLVAEYTYNGLNHRITEHTDTDLDGDVDSNDDILHFMYDDGWRLITTFREDDSDPKEYFTYHAPGIGGFVGSDRFILRDKDADTDWTAASDGTLEERIYYVQNWRGDVVNLLTDAGAQVESVRYSPYGVPFGMPAGDVDLDGDVNDGVNTDDTDQIQTWISGPTYDVRGDLDLDGDVDTNDKTATLDNAGDEMGRNVQSRSALVGASSSATGNRLGYAGYVWDETVQRDHVRYRVYDPNSGDWLSRDPLFDMNRYNYVGSMPLTSVDPFGLRGETVSPGPNADKFCHIDQETGQPLCCPCRKFEPKLLLEEGMEPSGTDFFRDFKLSGEVSEGFGLGPNGTRRGWRTSRIRWSITGEWSWRASDTEFTARGIARFGAAQEIKVVFLIPSVGWEHGGSVAAEINVGNTWKIRCPYDDLGGHPYPANIHIYEERRGMLVEDVRKLGTGVIGGAISSHATTNYSLATIRMDFRADWEFQAGFTYTASSTTSIKAEGAGKVFSGAVGLEVQHGVTWTPSAIPDFGIGKSTHTYNWGCKCACESIL